MNYAKINPCDIANGDGVRVSLFVSGCPHHCKGCFNQETWSYDVGQNFGPEELVKVLDLCSEDYIAGLSLLGGEPLDPKNLPMVTLLAYRFKCYFPHKTIWCYTGYRWEEVSHLNIMKYLDVVVDGKFVEELKDISLRFRGSSNQRIIDVKKTLRRGKIILRGETE